MVIRHLIKSNGLGCAGWGETIYVSLKDFFNTGKLFYFI